MSSHEPALDGAADLQEADTDRREVAIQQLLVPQLEIVAGQITDASRSAEDVGEMLNRLEQAEANLDLLVDVVGSLNSEE